MEAKMRKSLRTLVITLVAVGCVLIPLSVFAAESSAATAPDPTTAASGAAPTASGTSVGAGAAVNPSLVDLLLKKGILSATEADSLRNAAGSGGMEQLLLILKAKGIVNDSDVDALKTAISDGDSVHALVDVESGPQGGVQAAGKAAAPKAPERPAVIPAVAPTRVLALDAPKKDGLVPALKLGAVRVTPYGFIKATAAYDTSSPRGDDFPVPGFLNADTGPNPNPEFHLKARASRVGTRFEWPDVSKNITVTGQVEADFEGNFSRVDNRNISSIRSNMFQLRLAYGRIDWHVTDKSDIFFEGGQDWTIFGSSVLPNLLETTFFGAYWGNAYERSPQMRLGLVEKLGGSRHWTFSPEFAIMMPSEGLVPADIVTCTIEELGKPTTCSFTNGLGNQLGYGERQGADAGRPELEARAVLQFQLDKAPGVAPAQLVWSGFEARRQATVLASAVPAAYKAAFPRGVDNTSEGYGNQLGFSLPTRWVTLTASIYNGADLRFFFANQFLSNYNYTGGLTDLADGLSVDGSSTVVFGTNSAGEAVIAPQRPVRTYGGFFQVGIPLSRWFNADPKGRNAGWQVLYDYGLDAANAADFKKAKGISATKGGGPIKSTMNALTIFYKMNPWVTFGFEETRYQSLALPNGKGECTTKVSGLPACTWNDWRTEFGPVFTF
jgi:hypothetical protein